MGLRAKSPSAFKADAYFEEAELACRTRRILPTHITLQPASPSLLRTLPPDSSCLVWALVDVPQSKQSLPTVLPSRCGIFSTVRRLQPGRSDREPSSISSTPPPRSGLRLPKDLLDTCESIHSCLQVLHLHRRSRNRVCSACGSPS